ncbi:MAG: ABC transporter permease [Actinomycetota bacterium]|nr:ABC transporter permease [Actinomycetota bacterium]
MSLQSPTLLLAKRTVMQFPRNPMVVAFSAAPVLTIFIVFGTLFEGVRRVPGFPTDNYYAYIAPMAVLLTTVPGILQAADGLASDFKSRYFYKLMTTPASIGSIMLGRLLGDSVRLFLTGGGMLLLAMAFGARVETGIAGALLMLLIGTLFALVTFGVLTTNVAMKAKDPALIQAIFPMTFIMIFLTTGFQPKAQIESGLLKAVIDANPAEHVLVPMRDLMLSGYDWGGIGIAALVILGLGLLGLPLTVRNYRSVYR